MKRVIVKVRESNSGQKTVTIPKGVDIKAEDYVEIIKLEK